MTLIVCPDCGRAISDQATGCLQCSRPAARARPVAAPSRPTNSGAPPGSRPAAVVGVIIVLSFGAFVLSRACNSSEPPRTVSAVPAIPTTTPAALVPTPLPEPEAKPLVYLDAVRLRLLGRDAALKLVKKSGVWSSINQTPEDRKTGEELVELRASDGAEGLLVLEKGRVTLISLTFDRFVLAEPSSLSVFNLKTAEGKRQDFPLGARWRNPKGPYKLIDITTYRPRTVLTVDFLSSSRSAG